MSTWQARTNLGAGLATGDTLLVRDISDTTDHADGTVKEVTAEELFGQGLDKVLAAFELRDIAETTQIATSVNGAISYDYRDGGILDLELSGAVTSFAITNVPVTTKAAAVTVIVRNTNGLSFAWPSGTKWPGGTPPTLSSGATDIDEFVLITRNGGSEWLGHVAGQDFS